MINKKTQTFQTIIKSPIGDLLAEATNEALFSLTFLDETSQLIGNDNDILQETKNQLDGYFLGLRIKFDLPICLIGTPFQKGVWETLSDIKFGTTISYKEEAKLLKNPKAYRAVANANGKNPIPIIIPCHRVIASDGKIGGYSGEIWRKEFLLRLENSVAPLINNMKF